MLTVIYILGAGNSGSTLLSMVLGSHPKITTIGEFSQYDKYVAKDLLCSCQKRLSSCDFWSAVRQNLPGRSENAIGIRPHIPLSRLFLRHRSILLKDSFYPLTIQKNIAFYNAISRVSNAKVIVDASKDLARFFYLYHSGQINIVPLFMRRDGRAYLNSMNKRRSGHRTPFLIAPGRNGFFRSYFRWMRMNLTTLYQLKKMRFNDKVIHITYEEFTNHSEKVLERICYKIGLEFEPSMIKYFETEHHNIAGSPSRFSPMDIRPMENWKKRLPFSVKLAFSLLCGELLNRRIGIKT